MKNLCQKCNTLKGYYPLNISLSSGYELYEHNEGYVNCINEEEKPSNFYFNKINNFYEPCYEKCATCEYGGNNENNNCTSCGIGYILKPEGNN